MKINVAWVSPSQRTVLATFDKAWELADLLVAADLMHAMIKTVSHNVSIILWHRVPPHPMFSRLLTDIYKRQPDNTRRVVVVPQRWSTGLVFISAWNNVVERLYPHKTKITIVKTIEEALKLCEEPTPATV